MIRINGVSRLDSEGFKELLGQDVSFAPSETADFHHGDMATVSIAVAISALTLRVIAAWLVKGRRYSTIEREIEITQPDGSFRRERLRIKISEEDAAEADVLRALTELTAADPPRELPS